ncbi:TonB-dependent receptor [Arcobacter sp. FW59]|nr:TonB-dependent receptor [Arcobacter sp. FW59]
MIYIIENPQSSYKKVGKTYILDEVSVKEGMEDSYTRTQDNSATGMNLSLKETPQSVSVITSKRMEDQQLNNLVDVLKNTTGVYVNSQYGNVASAYIYSRGYEIKNYQIDGTLTTFPISYRSGNENINTAIYDSVSVVRGATGLLTGAGDPSGSINLVRKKPTKEFQASLEAQTGRWDKYRGVADIGGGFNEDGSIRGRFIAVHDQGGFWHPLLDRQNSTLYGIVEADLGDKTTVSASYERTEAKNNASYGTNTTSGDNFRFSYTGLTTNVNKYTWNVSDWSNNERISDKYILSLNHHINDSWKVDATYNYSKANSKNKFSTASSLDPIVDSMTINNESKPKSHSADIKLNGIFDLWGKSHDLVIGANGIKSKITTSTRQPGWADGTGFSLVNNRLVHIEPIWTNYPRRGTLTETEQYGAFISTKLNFTDDFSAILGGRYSEWKTKSINNINNKVTDDRKFDNFLPYLALTYDLTDNLTTYASYTEIFNPQNAKDRDDKFLDPETGFNYEVGLKGEWFDGRLNSSIALFQSGKDNLAVTDMNEQTGICYKVSGTNSCAMKAEDDTKNRGWEFEVAGEITPYWQAQFGFSSSILKDKNGKRLTSETSPIRTANLFTTYQATPQLKVGGGLRWQSETWGKSEQDRYIKFGYPEMVSEATQKDYFVVDLMANYEFNKNLSLLVNLNNALNKEYKTSFNTYSYGEERNWMATLKYKF